jgi:hypothetical protein
LITLPTGSILSVLGPPEHAAERFWDSPANTQQRADAWFWTCGCSAEPAAPGRFRMVSCVAHADAIRIRFERKSRHAATHGGPESASRAR